MIYLWIYLNDILYVMFFFRLVEDVGAYNTFACSKNLVDTEVMLKILADAGCEITPDETEADMLETVRRVAELEPDQVKIHLLHVLKGTRLAQIYENGAYEIQQELIRKYGDKLDLSVEIAAQILIIFALIGLFLG